ncbi:MAG: hypothetical protein Q7T82_16950 [Armatimonadota bacterium]|nr:hypothetical protein [Armatimonadota bacterium]
MLQTFSLNGGWKIRGFDGAHGHPEAFFGESCDETGFIDAQVPGNVHLDLERAGVIPDCNFGTNAQSARWVEEQVWVYRTTFDAPPSLDTQLSTPISAPPSLNPQLSTLNSTWLVFDGLDLNAVVYLNGVEIGRHANFFTPRRIDITGKLRSGQNTLAVRIDSGLYAAADKPAAPHTPILSDLLTKRAWLRKPQSLFSWDWAPRLITVGIWRGVRLEWSGAPRIDAVTIYPELTDDHKSAQVRARLFVDNPAQEPVKATARARVPQAGSIAEQEVEIPPGASRHDLRCLIPNPKLWWPRPHGDQPLYDVICEIEMAGEVVDRTERRTGIRSIRINRDKHPEAGEYFIVEVNGRPIFCKGGNWVPADTMPVRADAERYRRLVELAADANFNMLRIWGGGLYADHAMLDACDELGVMVWHDLIFACAHYPGDDREFAANVRDEVTHIVRDLSPHPSLVVWCGNNEIEWSYGHAHQNLAPLPDYTLYHYTFPRIMAAEDPSRPYWPSSPYSEGGRDPNDFTTGDQHPWGVSLWTDGPDFWTYRGYDCRFPNEGGVLGASSPATLRQCLPPDQFRMRSYAWDFHDNSCNFGTNFVVYRAIPHWLGVEANQLPLDDYLFYSALLQAEGLQEYAHNFRRRMFNSASAIFWMYNDCWPATHGWTIVDYYLRRKLSYHPVRRAFAPVHIIPAIDGDDVVVFGVNETPVSWAGKADFGLFTLDGEYPARVSKEILLPPNQSTAIGRLSIAEWDEIEVNRSAAYGVLQDADGALVAQNRLFRAKFKDLEFAPAEVSVSRDGERAVFSSAGFVWGVCLDVDGEADVADDVFDLLPGVPYSIPWPTDRPLPAVQRCGSPLRRYR